MTPTDSLYYICIDRAGRPDHKGPRYDSQATFQSGPGLIRLVCGSYTGLNQVVTDSTSQIGKRMLS